MPALIRLAALLVLLAGAVPPVMAQDFSPRLIVNGRAITNWEYEQRLRMLQLFNAPGDLEVQAQKVLVDERLQMAAADSIGLSVTPEAIQTGMEEFAARANLSAEEFLAALAKGGVAEESFRDFVRAGLLWREVVRARFAPRAQVTEAEIDRAVASITQQSSVRVLLAEMVIPIQNGDVAAARAEAQRIRLSVKSEADFNEAARRFSAAPTAPRGGALDWIELSSLPAEVSPVIMSMRSGTVTEPVEVDGAIALFFLRDIEQTRTDQVAPLAVEYALLALPAGRDPAAEGARIRADVDTCDDLYGVARRLPPEALVRETRPLADVPADLSAELDRLDDGESTVVNRGGQPTLLMLCGRVPQLDVAPSREAIRNQLLNRRLAGYANGYLEELRADALIREP